MNFLETVLFLIAIIISFFAGWFINSFFGKNSLSKSKQKAQSIIQEAQTESDNLKKEKIYEATEEIYNEKQKLEEEFRTKRNSLKSFENDLNIKDNNIDRKADLVSKKERELFIQEKELKNRENSLYQKQQKLDDSIEEANRKLETISGMTKEDAKKLLLNNLIEEAKKEAAQTIQKIIQDAEKESGEKARNIIISAMEQTVSNHTIESTVTTVALPSDDMKGRIIGKEGRNIRSFEIVTGVDVIVDDTPQAVLLSAFDPYRRHLAKLTMDRLVADGRIHPGRIEETYEKIVQEIDEHLSEVGEQVLHEIGIHGLHPEIVKTLGKLKYRSIYGQNVLDHCKEIAELSGILAAQLDLDSSLAKRAGILHKIGLVLNKQNESDFVKAGYDFIKKFGEHNTVLNAILASHNKAEANTPLPIIIKIADTISQARPGARRDVIENYVQRLTNLEEIATSFEGVQRAYAIQAGKEIRIIIDHEKSDDAQTGLIVKDIAKKIKDNIDTSVQLKMHVIREFRSISYA